MNKPNPKVNGYAHPRTTPGSRIDDRRKRAAALLDECRATHPRLNGRCAVDHAWALA